MAPPNRYTNTSSNITGNTTDMSSASALRLVSRTLRPIMTVVSRHRDTVRNSGCSASAGAVALCGDRVSDMVGLSSLLGGRLAGGGRDAAGQGEEDVVERGGVDGEAADLAPLGVDLVEQVADV